MIKFSNANTITREVVKSIALQKLHENGDPHEVIEFLKREFDVCVSESAIYYWHANHQKLTNYEQLPAVLAGVMNVCQDLLDMNRKASDRKLPIETQIFVIPIIQRLHEVGLGTRKIRHILEELGVNISEGAVAKWIHGDFDHRAIVSIDGNCVWTIGTVCTDGYQKLLPCGRKNEFKLKLVSKDLAYVQEFSERVAKVLNRSRPNTIIVERGKYFTCTYRSKAFGAIFGDRKHILSSLDTYYSLIATHPKDFIGALISGDGSIDIAECQVRIHNTNKKLLMTTRQVLVDDLGIAVREPVPYTRTRRGAIAYRLLIGAPAMCEIYDEVAPHVMQRRRVLWKIAISIRDSYSYKERLELRKKYSRLLNKLLAPLPKIEHIEDYVVSEFVRNPEKALRIINDLRPSLFPSLFPF